MKSISRPFLASLNVRKSLAVTTPFHVTLGDDTEFENRQNWQGNFR